LEKPTYHHLFFHVPQDTQVEGLVEFLLATTTLGGACLPPNLVSRGHYLELPDFYAVGRRN
jgi:hypothetical protein